MDIKEILKEEFIGEKFIDNHGRVWGITSQGGCRDKQTLMLMKDCGDDRAFIGYQIEKLFFISDIVNLKFKQIKRLYFKI